jgi:hypothetical protein
MRPLTNVEDAVKKLIWVYDNPDKVAEIEQRAYDWVQTLTWESIGQQWDELFTRVYSDLQKEREGLKKKKNGNSKTGTKLPTTR